MHRTKVRAVKDALDANDTIAADASDLERSGATPITTTTPERQPATAWMRGRWV